MSDIDIMSEEVNDQIDDICRCAYLVWGILISVKVSRTRFRKCEDIAESSSLQRTPWRPLKELVT